MLVKQLLLKLQEIEELQKQLKQEKKEIIKQAKQERVLEVNIMDLFNEMFEEDDEIGISINPIFVPKYVYGNMEEAKKYIIEKNVGFGIKLHAFRLTFPIASTRLANGENLIDNLEFVSQTQMKPKNEIVGEIMLNFGLDDPCMEKEYFKNAVLNCLMKNQEKTF